MVHIDKLSNKPHIYDNIISILLDEDYDINKQLEILKHQNKRYLHATFLKLLNATDCYVMYINEGNKEILAGICTIICDNIASIFILPQYRRNGYAKKLLEYVENDRNQEYILWAYNPVFIKIYENMGYHLKAIIQEPNAPKVITYTFCRRKSRQSKL